MPPPGPSDSPKRLDSLQVARGLAALSVVLFHSEVATQEASHPSFLSSVFNLCFTGVDFFFILSGFLMVWVHRRDFGQPGRLTGYLIKRLTRIYPIYWCLCLVLVPLTLKMSALRQNQQLGASSILASIALLPHPGNRLLGVTWTLEYELLFYAAFAIFFVSVRAGIAVFSAWFAAILASAFFAPLPLIPTGAPQFTGSLGWLEGFLLNLHLVEFFAGMLLAWLIQRGTRLQKSVWVLSAAILVAVALQAFAFAYGSHNLHLEQGHRLVTCIAGAIASVIIFSAVQWELHRNPPPALSKPLLLLGAASYSLYLSHFLVISFFRVLILRSHSIAGLPAIVLLLLSLTIALGVGLVLHLAIEKPILSFTSRRVRPRRPEVAALS